MADQAKLLIELIRSGGGGAPASEVAAPAASLDAAIAATQALQESAKTLAQATQQAAQTRQRAGGGRDFDPVREAERLLEVQKRRLQVEQALQELTRVERMDEYRRGLEKEYRERRQQEEVESVQRRQTAFDVEMGILAAQKEQESSRQRQLALWQREIDMQQDLQNGLAAMNRERAEGAAKWAAGLANIRAEQESIQKFVSSWRELLSAEKSYQSAEGLKQYTQQAEAAAQQALQTLEENLKRRGELEGKYAMASIVRGARQRQEELEANQEKWAQIGHMVEDVQTRIRTEREEARREGVLRRQRGVLRSIEDTGEVPETTRPVYQSAADTEKRNQSLIAGIGRAFESALAKIPHAARVAGGVQAAGGDAGFAFAVTMATDALGELGVAGKTLVAVLRTVYEYDMAQARQRVQQMELQTSKFEALFRHETGLERDIANARYELQRAQSEGWAVNTWKSITGDLYRYQTPSEAQALERLKSLEEQAKRRQLAKEDMEMAIRFSPQAQAAYGRSRVADIMSQVEHGQEMGGAFAGNIEADTRLAIAQRIRRRDQERRELNAETTQKEQLAKLNVMISLSQADHVRNELIAAENSKDAKEIQRVMDKHRGLLQRAVELLDKQFNQKDQNLEKFLKMNAEDLMKRFGNCGNNWLQQKADLAKQRRVESPTLFMP